MRFWIFSRDLKGVDMQVLTHERRSLATGRARSLETGAFPAAWFGSVEGLHIAPRSMIPTRSVKAVSIVEGLGIEGDRYARRLGFLSERIEKRGDTPNRLVTFFEAETIEALGRDHKVSITPEDHRRNITTRGVPLNHLIGREFRVGEAVLFGTIATPCKHLDDLLGISLINLLANRAGLNAGVIRGGQVRLGDRIELL
jgi:MOSC domain-containing protein YiiM